jgi:deoxyribodipyrimidine photolyase-related protein
MTNLIHILGDQLSFSISSLKGLSKHQDIILLAEVMEETKYAPHHKKKLIFILSAMRHFAESLKAKGFKVEYVKLDDNKNTGSLISELKRFSEKYKPEKIIVTEPSEFRVLEFYSKAEQTLKTKVEIREDDRFICGKLEFQKFFEGKKTLLMENFYRQMRKKTGLLMEKAKPVGGKWNYDKENRNAMPANIKPPQIPRFEPDIITQDVIKLIDKNFAKNFGESEGFFFAVCKDNAELFFNDFIEKRLKDFGKYQDAMRENLDFGFHSIISIYINIGLLDALECCKKVEKAFIKNKCELNSVEGFIRQIIGWREYIRGIYWMKMPEYKDLNFFENTRKLPWFYWDESKTDMNCMKHAIKQTRENAYSHHIQRLMVIGNFAMLAGINPDDVDEWYMAVYADAFEWVEMPNTRGMATYADGGIVGTKPYAASGKYINRMSNYCKKCKYDVNKTTGENACPFNFLYWDFIIRNKDKLEKNPRMIYPYLNLKNKSEHEIESIQNQASEYLNKVVAA